MESRVYITQGRWCGLRVFVAPPHSHQTFASVHTHLGPHTPTPCVASGPSSSSAAAAPQQPASGRPRQGACVATHFDFIVGTAVSSAGRQAQKEVGAVTHMVCCLICRQAQKTEEVQGAWCCLF